MNQGRVWCVVNPTVGLPLLLAGVALTSLAVHTAVMTHTTWMSNYWQGAARVRTSADGTGPSSQGLASTAPTGQAAYVLSIAPVAAAPGATNASFVVTVTPNADLVTAAVRPPASGNPARTAMNAP